MPVESLSKAIVETYYRQFSDIPGFSEITSEETYNSLSEILNKPISDPGKKIAVMEISERLFCKRNKTSIFMSNADYVEKQDEDLSRNPWRYFPEMKSFIEILDLPCTPAELDQGVLWIIDLTTQMMFSVQSEGYLEYKKLFFTPSFCETPLDFLFRGVYMARAKQNVYKTLKYTFVILLLCGLLFLCLW